MKIILSPLEFYEQETNIMVAVLLRIDAILKQVSTTKERDFVNLRQLTNQAVHVYSPNIRERRQHLDKEQYAYEVMSLEENRMEFSQNLKLQIERINEIFKDQVNFFLPITLHNKDNINILLNNLAKQMSVHKSWFYLALIEHDNKRIFSGFVTNFYQNLQELYKDIEEQEEKFKRNKFLN